MKNKLKKDLSWEIEVLPVQIKGQTTVLNKALVRSDDQKLIGIRSRYYKPVFNRDLEAMKEKNTPYWRVSFQRLRRIQERKTDSGLL